MPLYAEKRHYLKRDSDFKKLDYGQIFKERIKKLQLLQNDLRLQVALKRFYQENPICFIEDWVTTYNPNNLEQSTMPFILFKRQRQMIKWLQQRLYRREDGLIEKSREVGASYVAMAFSIWLFLFKPEVTIGFSSKDQKTLDVLGNPSSLLEKGRMILRTIPGIFLPDGFSVEKHCTHLVFKNPSNGSVIYGEVGDDIGRGGRATMYFKDESAFYVRPDIKDAALSHTSNCKIDMSTINKIGSPFHTKRFSGVIPVFVFDWRDDPRKDQNWYDMHYKKNPVATAREINRDWNADDGEVCIPGKWVQKAIYKRIDKKSIEDLPLFAGLDVADEGGDNNVLVIRQGHYVIDIHIWNKGNTHFTANKAFKICIDKGVRFLNYDGIGVGAGLKGEFEKLLAIHSRENNGSSLRIDNIKVGAAAPLSKNKQKEYANLKTYLWFQMRNRFEKTYEFEEHNIECPEKDRIYIPDHTDLIRELSAPGVEYNETGVIALESKKNVKKRLLKSHDVADAFMLAFHTRYKQVFIGKA